MRWSWLALALCGALITRRASAHPLSPVVLTLEEREHGEHAVLFRRARASSAALELVLPKRCRTSLVAESDVGDQRETRLMARCAGSLRGETLSIAGLAARELSALVYVAPRQGEPVRAVLSARAPSLRVPRTARPFDTFWAYFSLGALHLAVGADHLLFVAGLFLVRRSAVGLLASLTTFTLGHSVTLALSASGVVILPTRVAECGIALSLIALALEITRADARPYVERPWFGLVCGLLHGLGFASALSDAGFPRDERALCLFGFNLGLEFAQLVWVLLLLALVRASRVFSRRPSSRRRAQTWAGYGIGGLAFMWFLERLG